MFRRNKYSNMTCLQSVFFEKMSWVCYPTDFWIYYANKCIVVLNYIPFHEDVLGGRDKAPKTYMDTKYRWVFSFTFRSICPRSRRCVFYGRLWDHRADLKDVTCLTPMPRSWKLLPNYCNVRATLATVMLIHYTHNSKVLQKYMMIIICAYSILNHKKFLNSLYWNFETPSQFTKTDY